MRSTHTYSLFTITYYLAIKGAAPPYLVISINFYGFRTVPTGVQTELYAGLSLPLTRKVARRRRGGRREAIHIKFSLSLPQSFFRRKMTAPSSEGAFLLMLLGAPHKIDRCADRCSLYPPQAAVAYVARQREPMFANVNWNAAQS